MSQPNTPLQVGDAGEHSLVSPTEQPATRRQLSRAGKVRPMILLWALGIPIPLIIIVLLVRSCM